MKVSCPQCGQEGECQHIGGGNLKNGVFYDEYEFKCSGCNYLVEEGFPIGHPQNKCPLCGKKASI